VITTFLHHPKKNTTDLLFMVRKNNSVANGLAYLLHLTDLVSLGHAGVGTILGFLFTKTSLNNLTIILKVAVPEL
jgi:hypothetical protein